MLRDTLLIPLALFAAGATASAQSQSELAIWTYSSHGSSVGAVPVEVSQGGQVTSTQSSADGLTPAVAIDPAQPIEITCAETTAASGVLLGSQTAYIPGSPNYDRYEVYVPQPIIQPALIDSGTVANPAMHNRWFVYDDDPGVGSFSFQAQLGWLPGVESIDAYKNYYDVLTPNNDYVCGMVLRVGRTSHFGAPGAVFEFNLSGYSISAAPAIDVVHVSPPGHQGASSVDVQFVAYSWDQLIVRVSGHVDPGDHLFLIRSISPFTYTEGNDQGNPAHVSPPGPTPPTSGGLCDPPEPAGVDGECEPPAPSGTSGCPPPDKINGPYLEDSDPSNIFGDVCGDSSSSGTVTFKRERSVILNFLKSIFGIGQSDVIEWTPNFTDGANGNGQCKAYWEIKIERRTDWALERKLWFFSDCSDFAETTQCFDWKYMETSCDIP